MSNQLMNLIQTLSANDRMLMIEKGMSPLNPEHIKRFRKGQGVSKEEIKERAEIFSQGRTNLGGGHERDIDVSSKTSFNPAELEAQVRNNPADVRKNLVEDMNSYAKSAGKVFSTDDFVSLRQTPPPANNLNAESIKHEGFELSKAYLNAFGTNLPNPTYNTRLALFKALKACLEGAAKYKSNPKAVAVYEEGVKAAEKAFFQKLQG